MTASPVREPARYPGASGTTGGIGVGRGAQRRRGAQFFYNDSLIAGRYRQRRTTAAETVTGIRVGHTDADAGEFLLRRKSGQAHRSQSPQNSAPQGSCSARRRSTAARISSLTSSTARLQAQISSSVRKQPRQSPLRLSIWQTLTQGDATVVLSFAITNKSDPFFLLASNPFAPFSAIMADIDN